MGNTGDKSKSYESALLDLVRDDERFVVLTAENRALIRNVEKELEKRFIDTGITEQTLVGVSAGLALRGRIPIAHALAPFLSMRAFEFIRTDVGLANLPVKLMAFIPGVLSDGNGPTHQAIEDVSLMRGIPNIQVFAPADEQDLIICLPEILKSPYPSYVRLNHLPGDYDHHKEFKIGKAEKIGDGTDVSFIVYGTLFSQALIASEKLQKLGISVSILNIRTIKPIDENAIMLALRNSKLIVTIEDHFKIGGLSSIIAEIVMERQLTANLKSISMADNWFSAGRMNEVLQSSGLNADTIMHRVKNWLSLSK